MAVGAKSFPIVWIKITSGVLIAFLGFRRND